MNEKLPPISIVPRKPGGQVDKWGRVNCPECKTPVSVEHLERCPRCKEIVGEECMEGGICVGCGRDDERKKGVIE